MVSKKEPGKLAKANSNITHTERDGVEFYVIQTGESGMSIRGLARLAGPDEKAIRYYLNNTLGAEEKDWKLDVGQVWVRNKRGSSDVVVVKDSVCAKVISYYAKKKYDQAIEAQSKFVEFGVRKFIHEVTGWVAPIDLTVAQPTVTTIDLGWYIRKEPMLWERLFTPEWIAWAEKITGWPWSYQCMSRFINAMVYDYFPEEVRLKLDEDNPLVPCGSRASRKRKQHQHLTNECRKKIEKHLVVTETLMNLSGGDIKRLSSLMLSQFGKFKSRKGLALKPGEPLQPMLFEMKTSVEFLIQAG